MAQSVPSVLFHAQALKIIEDLRASYQVGVGSYDDLIAQLQNALTSFENTLGVPFLDFNPMIDGEPPLTSKINRLWSNLSHDVNILEQQADIGRSAAAFAHNLVTTEVLKAQQANSKVSNKLKTLQLYSKAVDSSIVTFGDHFESDDFIDYTRIAATERPLLLSNSFITLAQQGNLQDLSSQTAIRVLPTSNGLLGNLHEVSGDIQTVTFTRNAMPKFGGTVTSSTVNGVHLYVSGDGLLTMDEPIFKAEQNIHGALTHALDGDPKTWFEYEHCQINDDLRRTANGFNFTYQRRTSNPDGTETVDYVDWADGPAGGVLKLNLEFDLGSLQNLNYIKYLPFNLEDNSNYPVKVASIQTSQDRTDWQPVHPEDIIIGSTTNLQVGAGSVVGQGIWAFTGRVVRYIHMSIEQSHPINAQLGHLYYLDGNDNRVEGPVPSIENPTQFYGPDVRRVGNNIQLREIFSGKRWVIGVRDISFQNVEHSLECTLVTKPLRVGGVVDRLSLSADITIPPEYGDNEAWINFFVSPDDGANWYQIARVQDDFLNVPEIVAFNDPLPDELREPGVGYYSSADPVTSLRLKVAMRRPVNLASTTPVLHSYEIKVKKR